MNAADSGERREVEHQRHLSHGGHDRAAYDFTTPKVDFEPSLAPTLDNGMSDRIEQESASASRAFTFPTVAPRANGRDEPSAPSENLPEDETKAVPGVFHFPTTKPVGTPGLVLPLDFPLASEPTDEAVDVQRTTTDSTSNEPIIHIAEEVFNFPSAAPFSIHDYEETIIVEIKEEATTNALVPNSEVVDVPIAHAATSPPAPSTAPFSMHDYEKTIIEEIEEANTSNTTFHSNETGCANATNSSVRAYNGPQPSDSPYQIPSDASDNPSDVPSMVPSDVPSDSPSDIPSDMPSNKPSLLPSDSPSDFPSDIPSDSPSMPPEESNSESLVVNPNPALPPEVQFSAHYWATRAPTKALPIANLSPAVHPTTTKTIAPVPSPSQAHSLSPEVQFSAKYWMSSAPSNNNSASSLSPTFRPPPPSAAPVSNLSPTFRPTKAAAETQVFVFPTTAPPNQASTTTTEPQVFEFPSMTLKEEATFSPSQVDSETSTEEDMLEEWIASFLTDLPTSDPLDDRMEDATMEAQSHSSSTVAPSSNPSRIAPTSEPSASSAPSAMPSLPTLMFLESLLLPQNEPTPEPTSAPKERTGLAAFKTAQPNLVIESTESTTTPVPSKRTMVDRLCELTFSYFCK